MKRLSLIVVLLALAICSQAATITDSGISVASTTNNAANYTTASFTPAANDLLIIFCGLTGRTTAPGVTDSLSGTYTQITSALKATSADVGSAWVANQLASGSAMTVSCAGGSAGTGATIQIACIAGVTRVGLDAIRQYQTQANQAAATTPAPVFLNAALTGNPTLGFVFNATSPATMTPPTGWTEPTTTGDIGYSTPTTGAEYVFRNSGDTATGITWGGTSASAFSSIVIEVDTTATGTGTPVLWQKASGTAAPLTVPSTTAGRFGIAVFDVSTSAPTTVSIGAQSMTQVCTISGALCSLFSNPVSTLSVWIAPNLTGAQTSLSVTGGGTVNGVYWYEVRNLIPTTSAFDWESFCGTTSGSTCNAKFTPSTADEFVVGAENCSGSTAALGGSTWTNTAFPNGEGGGELVTSSIATVTATQGASCISTNGGAIVVGFRSIGETTTTCSSTLVDLDVSAQAAGTNPTASKAVTLHQKQDLIALYGFCLNGATSCTATPGFGTETVTQTGVGGNASASTGQPFIWYVLSTTNTPGSVTMSMATSGGATESQVAYKEFTPSPGCSYAHDVDSAVGTGTGATANTPSITPTGAGELLLNLTLAGSGTHVSTINSPWTCDNFYNASFSCEYPTSFDADAYILSGASGATANNITLTSGDWQALITSFTLSAGGGPAAAFGFNKRHKLEKFEW